MALTIHEHGIYERRDGKIFGCDGLSQDRGRFPYLIGGKWYEQNGDHLANTNYDLIREIVVGPGWLPWNGGENPVHDKHVEVAWRNGNVRGIFWTQELDWAHTGIGTDILAYRIVEESAETADTIDVYKDMVGAHPSVLIPDEPKRAVKLRPDLPEKFTVYCADNGGYAVYSPKETLAACSTAADLLAWLTEQPVTEAR